MRWLRNAAIVLFLILAFPVGLIAAIFSKMGEMAGIFSKGRKCTPQEFAAELQKFADGQEGPRDWDYLESVSILNAQLEAVRREACMLAPPIKADDLLKMRAKMAALAERARMISESDR